MTDATNQDDVIDVFEDQSAPGVETDQIESDGVDDQAEAEGDEDSEGEGTPSDNEDDDYEEVERGDKRYKIHKDLKDDLLRRDDYSRKTQIHAEEVRRFEQKVQAFDAASEESLNAAIEVRSIRDRMEAIQALTDQEWNWIRANQPDQYDRIVREMTTLPQKLAEAENTSKSKKDEVLKAQSEIQTKRIEQGQAILARDIPGWGPELGNKLVEFAAKEFGATADEDSEAFMNPKVVKMVHALYQARQSQQKAQTAKRAEQAQKTVPANTVKGGAAPKAGLHDKLSTEEWAARRNREIAAKGRP